MHATVNANQFRSLQLLLGIALLWILGGCATLPTPAVPPASVPARAVPPPSGIGSSLPRPNTIIVVGDGTTRVQANIAQITFSIEVVDASVLTAHRVAGDTMQSVLDTLTTLGIDAADFRPNSYNIWAERYYPGYVREDPGTVPLFPDPDEETLFRVIHQVYVLVREPERAAEVVDAMTEAGGEYFYLYVIDHLYDDPASLEPAAREKAVADAQHKAEEIAALIGVELGPVISISELVQGAYLPENLPVSVWPGEQIYYKQLQIEYAFTGSPTASQSTAVLTAAAPVPSTVSSTVSSTTTAEAAMSSAEITTEVTIVGGDEEALRQFLRQFFVQTFSPIQPSETTVYIGALPPEMPFSLQLPPALTVAGSVVTTGEYANSQILFTVQGDAGEQLEDLRGQLEQQGYTALSFENRGVFVTAPTDNISLCSEDGRLAVNLSGRNLDNDRDDDTDNGTGVLRIYTNVVSAFGGPCGQSGDPSSDPFSALMPTLTAPVPMAVYSSGGGGDSNSSETTIRFEADTDVAALAEHYIAQLEAHGWELLGTSQTEEMAWSGWSFSAESRNYTALFTVVRLPGADNRFQTTLRVEITR